VLLCIAAAAPVQAKPALPPLPRPGCTTIYASDGQTVLAGNNEDFNDPLTRVWFIPASSGKYGRVYFGYDDYIPQGGLNDQGVFFDELALEYKPTPLTDQLPPYPGGSLSFVDHILATSANVQDVIDLRTQWYRPVGEYSQQFFGDRFGDSVIFDGDTVLRKQGAFQIATNFRLVEHPDPPYPEERYGVITDMLSNADHFSVDLFRQALDAAHAEGDYPTIYSQIYELETGIIHLYQYHDFEHEVVLNLADELAKGPHTLTIASLFPENPEYEQWADQQVQQWQAGYMQDVNEQIEPSSLVWISGQYDSPDESEIDPVKIYLENDQLYLQKPYTLPIELYPTSADTVFHRFLDGLQLTLIFQRDQQGQATGAQGSYSLAAYSFELPYQLTRVAEISGTTPWRIWAVGALLGLVVFCGVLWLVRKRSSPLAA
jgi:hypothetical protein